MYKNISLHDLLLLPDFKLAAKLDDKEAMEKILWNLGVDIHQPYEWHECLHRVLSHNQPWFGLRLEAKERLDREWTKGAWVSLEALAHSSEDKSLKKELLKLNPDNVIGRENDYTSGVDIGLLDSGEDCV